MSENKIISNEDLEKVTGGLTESELDDIYTFENYNESFIKELNRDRRHIGH